MFRFKLLFVREILLFVRFQYILCFGSRKRNLKNIVIYTCFNTSYVSVQESFLDIFIEILRCFNTSYVSVQGVEHRLNRGFLSSFNTSYVSVQEYLFYLFLILQALFQYILCFGSSKKKFRIKTCNK